MKKILNILVFCVVNCFKVLDLQADNTEKLQKELELIKADLALLKQANDCNKDSVTKKDELKNPSEALNKLSVGGYVKFLGLNDFSEIGENFNRDYSYAVQLLYKDDKAASYGKEMRMHAKESRLVFTYKDKINIFNKELPVFGFMDFDCYNGKEGNGLFTHSYQPRVRNCYIEIGNVKIGATWTLFMDLENFPKAIDFGNSTGLALLRQPQIQYKYRYNDNLTIAASIENPDSAYIKKNGAKTFSFTLGNAGSKLSRVSIPDFIVAARYKTPTLNTSLRGVVTRARSYEAGKQLEKYGGGIGWSVGYNVFAKDLIIAHLTFGKGMGRYLHDTADSGFFLDDEKKRLHKHKVFGVTTSYRHYWRPDLMSNINFGYTKISLHKDILNQERVAADDNRAFKFFDHLTTLHTNLIWKPMAKCEIGLEYFHIHKFRAKFKNLTSQPQRNGYTDRILISLQYNF